MNETAKDLVAKAGKTGLESLSLKWFRGLDASLLELAGAALTSLDLATDLVGEPPNRGWSFPFLLRHFALPGYPAPRDFLPTLLASSFNSL